MTFLAALAASLALHVSAMAQEPAQPSIQQQFDAAEAARQVRDWPEALRQLEALEARSRNPRTLALVRVRKGAVLIELGRNEEGAAAIRLGLPGIAEEDATLHSDRFLGLLNLGLVMEHELDYPEALQLFRRAAAIPVAGSEQLLIQRGLIQTQLFTDAQSALRDANVAIRLAAAEAPENRELAGQFHTLKGRALLNLGRFAEARAELRAAMRLLGNLTLRVNRADLLARSDLAIAAMLAGDPGDARRYLAFTGAGQFERGRLELNPSSRPARCEGGIRPDDVVVLEFIIGEDGSVLDVKPIYASRQGDVALAFARAARHWTFDADEASEVPALFRSVVRLEVRCANTADFMRGSSGEFLATADPRMLEALSSRYAMNANALRAELASLDRAPTPDRRSLLAVLLILGKHPTLRHAERTPLLRRALPIAVAMGAPSRLTAMIAIQIAYEQKLEDKQTMTVADYAAILAMPEVSGSAEITAHVRLSQARALFVKGDYDEAFAIVDGVRTSPAAASDESLVTRARELEIALHAARGNIEAARAAFQQLGENAPRCIIEPRSLGLRTSSSDFPTEALRWGFEGWAINEVSVAPEGRVAGSRTIAAYPPFVFGGATTEITERTRYAPFFVPDGRACVIGGFRITFRLPDR